MKGCVRWNWCGTLLSQEGVYHFKSRWNTIDRPYRYFVREYADIGSLRCKSKSDLLDSYPYFYTLPFRLLAAES